MNHRTQKLFIAVTIVFLLLCLGASAQVGLSPFSGDMTMKPKQGEGMKGKIYFSGNKMRMDMNARGHQSIMINDIASKIVYMVMPEQKMYMEMRAGQGMTPHGPKMPDLKSYDPDHPCAGEPDMTCEKIGTETVNDRSTEKWVFKNAKSGSTTTAWIDRKLHFPVKSVTNDGTEMDLTNIQEGASAASMFEVPAGYRKFDVGAMMGGQAPH